MKQMIKSLLFSEGRGPREVKFGAGKGLRINVDPANQSQRLLGLAEIEITDEFVDFAGRCKTFCDVGASDGWYSLLARKVNPSVKIIAFEPGESLGKEAREHFALNGLKQDDSLQWIAGFCGTAGTPLDSVLGSAAEPIFLKIDIEGGELDALTSGVQAIEKKKCLIIVETHSRELEIQCTRFLQERGYRVRIIAQGWYRSVVPETRPGGHNQWLIAEK